MPVPDGAVARMVVELTTVTPVAALVPNLTVAPVAKPAPEMVTLLPPASGPWLGLRPVTTGVKVAVLVVAWEDSTALVGVPMVVMNLGEPTGLVGTSVMVYVDCPA